MRNIYRVSLLWMGDKHTSVFSEWKTLKLLLCVYLQIINEKVHLFLQLGQNLNCWSAQSLVTSQLRAVVRSSRRSENNGWRLRRFNIAFCGLIWHVGPLKSTALPFSSWKSSVSRKLVNLWTFANVSSPLPTKWRFGRRPSPEKTHKKTKQWKTKNLCVISLRRVVLNKKWKL